VHPVSLDFVADPAELAVAVVQGEVLVEAAQHHREVLLLLASLHSGALRFGSGQRSTTALRERGGAFGKSGALTSHRPGVNLRPGRNPTQKADSEIFNKFGPASGAAGVPCAIVTWCPMDSSR
jgi:hypothetical protein